MTEAAVKIKRFDDLCPFCGSLRSPQFLSTGTFIGYGPCDCAEWQHNDQLIREVRRARRVQDAAEQAEQLTLELCNKGGLPESMKDDRFDCTTIAGRERLVDSENKAGFAICERFCMEFPKQRSIWISGPTGTGKTTLAVLCANAIIRRGWRVLYIQAANFLKRITTLPDMDIQDRIPIFETQRLLKNAELVVIDDIGKAEFSERFCREYFAMVDAILPNPRRGILMTSKEAPGEITARFGRTQAELNRRLLELRGENGKWATLTGSPIMNGKRTEQR